MLTHNMPNVFDTLKLSTFDIVARTMGYDCFWGQLSARVFLSEPTQAEALANLNYEPRMTVMEYRAGDFPGLFDAVRSHDAEFVTINGRTFTVRDVQAVFDGDTYRAQLVEESQTRP
jgi:hypothetical protein